MSNHPTVFPCIAYDDPRAAIDWLALAFGLERHAVHAAPDGSIAHAELSAGPGLIMIGAARPDHPIGMRSARQGGPSCVYVVVADVDAHCARARAAGAEILRGPEDTPYGSREYAARDVEGNLWSF